MYPRVPVLWQYRALGGNVRSATPGTFHTSLQEWRLLASGCPAGCCVICLARCWFVTAVVHQTAGNIVEPWTLPHRQPAVGLSRSREGELLPVAGRLRW